MHSIREEQHCFSVGNAQCAKDNCNIVKGTFGRLLNEEMKSIGDAGRVRIWLPDVAWGNDGSQLAQDWSCSKVTIGEHEEGDANATNNECASMTLFTAIPVDLWMLGNLKWIAAAFGKENSLGHWCP